MAVRIALPNPVSRFQSMRPSRPLAIKPTRTISTAPPSSPSNLASSWRLMQGSNDWNHLTKPLHPLLRSEIVRYAELVMACYKAFDLNPLSNRYLNCKHSKYRLLGGVGLPAAGYDITRYIYATPNIPIPTQPDACRSRWIGYVAVSTDESSSRLGRRDVLVSFRGTVTSAEWIANLMSSLAPARLDPHDPRPDVRVASGFLSLYTSDDSTCRFTAGSCREQLLSEISRILSKYRREAVSITLAGHSMGSALAMLLGYDIAELGMNREAPVTVYSYGGPRVGNAGFRARCSQLGVKVLRVVNVNDPITKLPGALFNSSYEHVGVEVPLDFFKMGNPACVHDLDAYIGWLKIAAVGSHGGDQGSGLFRRFESLLEMWQQGGRRFEGELVQSP